MPLFIDDAENHDWIKKTRKKYIIKSFIETEHPRAPEGTEKGGEFVKKEDKIEHPHNGYFEDKNN